MTHLRVDPSIKQISTSTILFNISITKKNHQSIGLVMLNIHFFGVICVGRVIYATILCATT